MSGKRRSAGPIRQLSLQQPATTASRRPLKKQQSVDSERLWSSSSSINSDVALRVTASSITKGGHFNHEIVPKASSGHGITIRPRPVKLAWTDRRQQSFQQENQNQIPHNTSNVEVVAKRCMGQPRPVTAKPQRAAVNNLPAIRGDKDSILYTRQQLAERLRKAWKEREQSRPNLDIFLAHSSIDQSGGDDTSPAEICTNTSSDVRPETVIVTSEPPLIAPLGNTETSSLGNFSPSLPRNGLLETAMMSKSPGNESTAKSKTPSPQSSSTDLLYSSTAAGVAKTTLVQKSNGSSTALVAKTSVVQKSNVSPQPKSNSVASSSNTASSTSASDSLFTTAVKYQSKQIQDSDKILRNMPPSQIKDEDKIACLPVENTNEKNSHNPSPKLHKVNFTVFPRTSVIIIPQTPPNDDNSIDNMFSQFKSTGTVSSLQKTSTKFCGVESDQKESLKSSSDNITNYLDKIEVDGNANNSTQLDLKQGCLGTGSEGHALNSKIVVDVSPRKKEPYPSEDSTIGTTSQINTRTGNQLECNQDEGKENKINGTSTKSSTSVNNHDSSNNKVVQPPQTPTVNRIPNTAEIMSATVRRVNFRNSLNKTIAGSFSSDIPPSIPSPNNIKSFSSTTHNRSSSAPAQRIATRSVTPQQHASSKSILQRNKRPFLQGGMSADLASESGDLSDGEDGEEDCYGRGDRNSRFAPARRRLKSAGPRRKIRGRGEESSGDEGTVTTGEAGGKEEKKNSAGPRVGRRGLARGAEIVTMVSLMSDGSDAEADPSDAYLQPSAPGGGVAPWLDERNKWMGNSTGQAQHEQTGVTPAPPRVVCLRKSPKSVTFQQQSPPESKSLPPSRTSSPFSVARRIIPVTAAERDKIPASNVSSVTKDSPLLHSSGRQLNITLTVPSQTIKSDDEHNTDGELDQQEPDSRTATENCPTNTTSETSPTDLPQASTVAGTKNPIQENPQQEKVPSPCSSVLVTEPPSTGLGVMVARILKPEHTPIPESIDVPDTVDGAEPEFQTPKERECWQLYRRMLEKGVSVSYETVLRGMLTPTEYRLRRTALLTTPVRQLV